MSRAERRIKTVIFGELPEGVVIWLQRKFKAREMPELLEEAERRLQEEERRALQELMSLLEMQEG